MKLYRHTDFLQQRDIVLAEGSAGNGGTADVADAHSSGVVTQYSAVLVSVAVRLSILPGV